MDFQYLENEMLIQIIKDQTDLINQLNDKLQKYTNPPRYKKYYEANREKILQKCKERKQKALTLSSKSSSNTSR